MMRSYNLRGTNGSGKTFVARALMKESNAQILSKAPNGQRRGKVIAYEGELFGATLIFLGSYETQCGGCDTIDSVAKVASYLEHFMISRDNGIVFFEGLMISHMLGTVGAMQALLGKERNILAFLDTPLEVCIERVVSRRLARGDHRPFDPKNIVADHPRVQSCKRKAITQGYRVIDVNHDNAYEEVKTDLFTLLNGGDL